MYIRPLLFILIIFLTSISGRQSFGQEYSWRYYSVGDGLPQTQIYTLFQDSKGVIWIGTKGGLSKFDGIEFENYTSKDGLDFDFVTLFQEDSLGGIYIGTKTGVNYMRNGKISSLDIPTDRGINFLEVDHENYIWVNINGNELACFRDGKRVYTHPLLDIIEPGELISHFSTNVQTNELSVITHINRTIIWDGKKAKIISDEKMAMTPLFSNDGKLFGMDWEYLYEFSDDSFRPIFELDGKIPRCIKSRDDIYLVDTKTYSYLYYFDGEKVSKFHQRFNMITTILVDDEDNLWVGTESGLWRLEGKGFQNYLSDEENNFYTWSVIEDAQGQIWFGSYLYGLMRYNGAVYESIPVQQMAKRSSILNFYSGGILDAKGDVLFGTNEGFLKRRGDGFEWIYHEQNGDAIMDTYHDMENRRFLVASSHHGLFEMDYEYNINIHRDRSPRQNTGLVTTTLVDKHNRIWISGKQGVSIKEYEKWRDLPDEHDSIAIGAISMLKDNMENIWLGSNDGLYFYDYKKLRKIGGSAIDGQVGVLNLTDKKELLVGTINGIGILNLEEFYESGADHIRFFDANNGFLGTECKHNSSFKDSHGNIWICTSDRVVKVNPRELSSNQNPPRVYIKNLSTLSENMEWQPVHHVNHEKTKLFLDAKHDDIRFNYHAISHGAPSGVKYQTTLEGYDKEWSATTTERYRTYTNLPHGSYTYKVRAANIDGVWTKDFASLLFTIQPAWHELLSVRVGGFVVLVFMAAGIGYLYAEQRKRIKYAKDQNEKTIAKLQFKSLRALIDPHFTFNAINSIASMVYKENRDEAYNYFTKFSRLIRAAFDNSDNTTRSIKEEIGFVSNYLEIEKMRFKDRFEYEIQIEKRINTDWKIPKMIIQIYVENAVKHGLLAKETGGKLTIGLELDKDRLQIVIRDNGVGRQKSSQPKSVSKGLGQGTQIMRNYFTLLNKFNEQKIRSSTRDLKDENNHASGTEVVVSIPLSFKFSI